MARAIIPLAESHCAGVSGSKSGRGKPARAVTKQVTAPAVPEGRVVGRRVVGQRLKCFQVLGETFLQSNKQLTPMLLWRGVSKGLTGGGSPGLNEDDAWVPPGFCCPWTKPAPGGSVDMWPAKLSELTYQQLYEAVKAHICGISSPPSPFVSVTPIMATALDFATGRWVNKQWHKTEQDVNPGKIAVLNPRSVPNLHERMLWAPHVNEELFGRLKCEFLIYGPIDVREADLRWVTVAEIQTALDCGQWPRCPLQDPTLHHIREEEMRAAWKLGSLFAKELDGDWVQIVVAVYELARQQVKDFTFLNVNDAVTAKLYGHADFSPEDAEVVRRFILHNSSKLALSGMPFKDNGGAIRVRGLGEPNINRATRGFPVLYIVNHFIKWFRNGSLVLSRDEISSHKQYVAQIDEDEIRLGGQVSLHHCTGPVQDHSVQLSMKSKREPDQWNFSYNTRRAKDTWYGSLKETYASLADSHRQVINLKDLVQERFTGMAGKVWVRIGPVWYKQDGDLWYALPAGVKPEGFPI